MTTLRTIRVIVILAMNLLPACAWADTAPLVGDTFTIAGSVANFGSLGSAAVGGSGGAVGLLVFDLSGIPGGSNVSSAHLFLYVDTVQAAGSMDVYSADSSWAESTVSGVGGPGASTLIQTGIAVITANNFISVDVSAQVQGSLGGSTNNGFLLQGTSGLSAYFDSKENTNTSHPARLEIILSGVVGNAGATGVTGATGDSGATGQAGATGATGTSGGGARREPPDLLELPGLPGPAGLLEQRDRLAGRGQSGQQVTRDRKRPTGPPELPARQVRLPPTSSR
jgi:hypothetical protein